MRSEVISGSAVVALLAFSNADRPSALLDRRIVRFYGRISYSFYLLHPLTLIVMWVIPGLLGTLIASVGSEAVVAVALFAGSTLAITPLAYAMVRWIERPGIAAGRAPARVTVRPI